MGNLLGPDPARTAQGITRGRLDAATCRRLGCKVCPLNQTPGKIDATGAKKPLLYFLGEAAGANEERERKQFIGKAGRLLREYVPQDWLQDIRWNNVINCHPENNANPTPEMVECCKPRVIPDIEKSKPFAIVGFGNIPLEWATGFNGITMWRGRRTPIKVGDHVCWYYPMVHPSYLSRNRRNDRPSAEEETFEHDMKRMFAEVEYLPDPVVHSIEDARAGVETLTEYGSAGIKAVRDFLDWMFDKPVAGIDYETNGLRPYFKGSKILTAAIGNAERVLAFPYMHRDAAWAKEDLKELTQLWIDFIMEYPGVKAVHNLAFELEWSGYHFGHETVRGGRWEDSQSQAVILDERKGNIKPGPQSLEFLVQQHFGFNLKDLSGLNRKKLDNTPVASVLAYNGLDSKYHALLWEAQDKLIREEGMEEAYELALRRVPTVVLSQLRGIPVQQDEVKRLSQKYEDRIEATEKEIAAMPVVRNEFFRLKGREFRPLSNPDVLTVFDDILGFDEVKIEDKYTKETRRSTDESVLQKIDHPLAKALLTLRKATKRKSTYIDVLDARRPDSEVYDDGLIHPQFNTTFAETGRLSADHPPVQQYPKREEEAREVRRPVGANPGEVVFSLDYGQIEARVIAMFTKDKRFCEALWNRYDIHMEWAERLAHAYPRRIGTRDDLKDKKVMKDFRTDVKNQWTFPLFFGARLESAAGYLSIPADVIKPLYEEFWDQFSGVKTWQDEQFKFYKKYGYVECLTGRRRRGPLTVNQIYNSPVQGTAAEIVMDGMCRLSETGDPAMQPELNIHDDLTWFRVPKDKVEDHMERVLNIILKPSFDWINVPITVEMGLGDNWMELKDIGEMSSDEWFPG